MLSVRLMASVFSVRHLLGRDHKESSTEMRPMPFATTANAWKRQMPSSASIAQAAIPNTHTALARSSTEPTRSLRRHCDRWPSVKRLTAITADVSRQ